MALCLRSPLINEGHPPLFMHRVWYMLHHLRQTPLFCMQSIPENHWSALHRTWQFSPQEGTFSMPVWTHGDRNLLWLMWGLPSPVCSFVAAWNAVMELGTWSICVCVKKTRIWDHCSVLQLWCFKCLLKYCTNHNFDNKDPFSALC